VASSRVLMLLSKVVVGEGSDDLDIEIGKLLGILPEECVYIENHNKETGCLRVVTSIGRPYTECPRFTRSVDATLPYLPDNISVKIKRLSTGVVQGRVGDTFLHAETIPCALIAALIVYVQEEKELNLNQGNQDGC